MSSADFARTSRRRIIAGNPTTITIHRVDNPVEGSHRGEVRSIVGPFTVRIYWQGTAAATEVNSDPGSMVVDRQPSLIADETADLRAGAYVTDEFDVAGVGHFRIRAVHPATVGGEIVGYVAALEMVN